MERSKQTTKSSSAYGKIGWLLHTHSDNEDDNDSTDHAASSAHGDSDSGPHQPWLKDFHSYLRLKDQLQENMSTVQ